MEPNLFFRIVGTLSCIILGIYLVAGIERARLFVGSWIYLPVVSRRSLVSTIIITIVLGVLLGLAYVGSSYAYANTAMLLVAIWLLGDVVRPAIYGPFSTAVVRSQLHVVGPGILRIEHRTVRTYRYKALDADIDIAGNALALVGVLVLLFG